MRHKILLIGCFLGLSVINPFFSQVQQSSVRGIISPDSLRGFDERAWRVNSLYDGFVGNELNVALYIAQRQFINNKYFPLQVDPEINNPNPGNYKGGGNVIYNAPCVNEGFELGNFTGWTLSQGTNTNSCAIPTTPFALLPGVQATVVSTPLIDPVTGALVPNSPLGGSMVAVLGNTIVGSGKATKIAQTFLVTNTNYLYDFVYYAVQNGPHTCCQQPLMYVRLKDCVGNPLACPIFSFNAPATNSITCPGTGPATWSNTGMGCPFQCTFRSNGWQKYSIDLTQYIGTCISVEVIVADCMPTGHYLYSYFDSNCNQMNLGVNGVPVSMPNQTVFVSAPCASTATLTAPAGLSPYLWNGPPLSGVVNNTNQVISTAIAGNYTLIMTPVGICNPITRIVNLTFAPPATITANPAGPICLGNTATLTASGAINYTWNPGGIVSTSVAVSPTTTTIYTLTAVAGTCIGTFTYQVVVNPSPTITASANNLSVCAGGPSTLTASGAASYTWNPGAIINATALVTPTISTTYTVVGSTGPGCSASATINIAVVPTPTSFVTIASPSNICIGGNSNLFASALGATGYTWFPGGLPGNLVNVTPTVTTIYTVVAANGGCTNSAVCTVSVDPGPTLTVTASPTAICPGSSATLSASGAITYTWNPGAIPGSSIVVSPIITTNYSVTGTNALGCTNTATITEVVNPVPSLTITPASPSVCIGSTITLTASGAATYTWNPGALNTTTIAVSPTINTTYTIIGSNGTCTSSTTASLTVVPLPTVTAVGSTPSICVGSSATLTGFGATTYTWNPGALAINPAIVSPTITTNYTVTGATAGCSSTATVGLTVINGPTITATANPTNVCAGSSSTLTALGALGYTWNPGALLGSTVSVSPPSTTTYSVVGNNISGCTTTQTVILNVTPNPTVTVVPSSPSICVGNSATLTANGAATYTWNPGALSGSVVIVSPTITTNYTVNGLSGGCPGQTTITINVVPVPTVISASSSTAVCNGSSATLTAIGATSYTWNPGALTGSNVVVTPTITTNYTVTGSNGACSSTSTITLIVNPNPTVTSNASPTAVCVTGNVTLTAAGALTYTWIPGALPGATVVVTPTITTIYTVTGANIFGCTGTSTVNVQVNAVPILTLAATPTAVCNGASSTLTALGATSYTWNPGALTGSNVVVTPTITTNYTVTASNGGCTTTGTVTLIVNPNPTVTATASPTNICSGSSSTLTGLGAATYTWNPGALVGTTVSVNPLVSTQYTVTGATIFGCTSTTTVNLIVTPTPTVTATASPTAICVGAISTLTASGAGSYTWNPGALTGSNVPVSPTITTIYTVTGANGLCTSTQTVSVLVNPTPTLTAGASPSIICIGAVSTLTISGANTYTWNPGALTGSNVVVTPTITTVYTATGTSVFGCTSTAVTSVTVNPLPTLTITSTATNICSGSSATLTGSGAVTYTWNPGALPGATVNVTPTVTTVYTLTGANIFLCSNTATFNLIVTPTPTVTANASPSILCSGASSTLTANGAGSYTWNPGALPGATINVTPTITTIYTVTGANGLCTSTQTVSVVVNPTPTLVTLASPSVICSGSSSTLTVNGANTYTWNPGALTGSNVVVTPTATTNYTVLGVSLAGCSSTAALSLSVNPNPTVSIAASSTVICLGGTSTLTGNGATNYTWQPGGAITTTLAASPTITTVYTLTGANGACTNSITITLSVNPLPVITANASPTIVCAGAQTTLTAGGGITYTWVPPGIPGTSVTANPTITTTYTVFGVNGNGCTNQATLTVSVTPAPTLTAVASPTSICLGQSSTLTASGANTYTWQPGAMSGTLVTVNPTITTTYTLSGTNLAGCSSSQTIQLVVLPIPTVTAISSPTAICLGGSATITANGAISYTWQPGNILTATAAVSPTITTIYTVTGSNGICGSASTTLSLIVNPLPANVTASVSGVISCATPSVNLFGSTTSTNVSYLWNGPGAYTSAVQNPTGIAIPGTYTFIVNTIPGGCASSATVTVLTNSSIPTVTATQIGTITCGNPSATLTAASSATNPGYNWAGPLSFTSTSQTVSITNAGTYTLTVTDLTSNCPASTVITVLANTNVPITATIIPATCNGTVANNNAEIIVAGFGAGDKYSFVAGLTYTGGATYATATVIPVGGILTNTLNNPVSIKPYTLRLFGANGCFKDTTLFLDPTSCLTNTVFGIAKAVSTPSLKLDGSYDVNYVVVVKNRGVQALNNVQLTENLSNTFPLPTTFSITSMPVVTTLGSSITIDPTFNGSLQPILTSTTSSLPPGQVDTIKFSLNIKANGKFGPFNNTVLGFASPTLGIVFGDSSNTGFEPDPDLDGNPTNNNLPTVLNLPPNMFFGLTKVGTVSERLPDNTFDISYTVTVHNLGNDTLTNITVKDSLFGKTIRQPATYTMKSAPMTTGNLVANTFYNGNSDINLVVAAQSKMPPGAVNSIEFVINVNPDTITVVRNSAFGNAINSTSIAVSDTSNNGNDPDTNDNGVWNEPADNVPTVLTLNNYTLFIPGGFSPNGDGKNDLWVINGLPVENTLTIYNRWGNKIYKKTDYDNTWGGYPNVSGTLGNEKLPQGTYYYIIEFKDGTKAMNGFVVLQY